MINQIEKLLYDEPNFQELLSEISNREKTIFHIISKENDELTFSRTLKYFLDPNESHGLTEVFLDKFLKLACKNTQQSDSISRIEIDLLDLKQAKVYREFTLGDAGRADIIIDLYPDIFVIIENKIWSSEGDVQTIRYYDYYNEHLKNKYTFDPILVFLTPNGEHAECEKFCTLSFLELLNISTNPELKTITNSESTIVLDHFNKWVTQMAKKDEKIVELCRKIYAKHKDAINVIMENAPTTSAYSTDVKDRVNSQSNLFTAHSGENWICISPKHWVINPNLKATSKYAKVRFSIDINEEVIEKNLIIPQDDSDLKTAIEYLKVALQKDEFKHYKNWGNYYINIERKESFIPENLADNWDMNINETTDEMISFGKKILTEDLITSLKSIKN